MGHVRNRSSCGCEVNNMLHARSLHTKTKGSNSPYPPQTGGSKVDDSRAHNETSALYTNSVPRLQRPSLDALGARAGCRGGGQPRLDGPPPWLGAVVVRGGWQAGTHRIARSHPAPPPA